MTFKNLIQTNTWETISSIFLEIYPDAEKSLRGYKTVFEKLKMMEPEEADISIVISKQIDGNEEYFDVSGLHNNPKNKEEEYSQGIELTPWCKWLGMDVSKESLSDYSESEIIVHCLYEMTFVGFSEEDILKAFSRIEKNRKDRKSMTDKKKYESAASVDEFLKEWMEPDDYENQDD